MQRWNSLLFHLQLQTQILPSALGVEPEFAIIVIVVNHHLVNFVGNCLVTLYQLNNSRVYAFVQYRLLNQFGLLRIVFKFKIELFDKWFV